VIEEQEMKEAKRSIENSETTGKASLYDSTDGDHVHKDDE